MRRCPRLSEAQIVERLNWCLLHLNNDFDYFAFIDESKISDNHCKYYHIRKKSSRPDCIILSRTTFKLNIWGGISKRGATEFVVSEYEYLLILFFLIHILFLYLDVHK
jgi:hypothetical protein